MIPLEQAERASRRRPTVEGARDMWRKLNAPVSASSLLQTSPPAREWAVEGLIPHRTVTLLSGDGGLGKSTLALQLACCTALGRPWLGRETRQGPVVYVSCEDDRAELHRRLDGICTGELWDRDAEGFADLLLMDRVGLDSAVMMRGEAFGTWDDTPFWIEFGNWLRDTGPALVVMDALYDFFGTASQLDMGTARLFMGKLRELAHDAGCSIVLLWHPSKSGMRDGDGTSGNVAFRNAARAMLYLERDPEAEGLDTPRILRAKKSNYGPLEDEIRLQWEDGRFIPVMPQGGAWGMVEGITKRNAERAFLEALRVALDAGFTPSYTKDARDHYAPRLLHGRAEVAGYAPSDLEKAMRALLAKGDIVPAKTAGPPSRRKTIVVPKDHPLAPTTDGGTDGS